MKQQIPLYLLIAGTGTIIGLLLQRPVEAPTQPVKPATSQQTVSTNTDNAPVEDNTPDPSNQLDAINSKLDDLLELIAQETKQRKQLAQEVDSLKQNLATINAEDSDESNRNQSRTIRTHQRNAGTRRNKWFNDQAMINAGVDVTEATRIRQLYEDVEMKKLYLRDQAIRDGTIGSEDYRNKQNELNNQLASLRDELGEDVYDAYLYAAGQPNRVIVLSALKNSPASQAGIQSGDTILRYDNQRIFSWNDLRTATTQGDLNTTVLVEVMRDGKPLNVYVPRGPLGVQLDNSSVAP
jgi:hypothetical protein